MLFNNINDGGLPVAEISEYFGKWTTDTTFVINPALQKGGSKSSKSPLIWHSTGRQVRVNNKIRTLFSHPSHPELRLRKMVERKGKVVATYIKYKQ